MKAPLFAYIARKTPIHALPAWVKLLLLSLLAVPVFSGSRPLLLSATACLLLGIILARTPLSSIIDGIRFVFFYGILILFFRLTGRPLQTDLAADALRYTLLYLWQIGALYLGGTLFYQTTPLTEILSLLRAIQASLEGAISRIRGRRIHLPDWALLLSLTILFIPRIFSRWESLSLAWKARGGNRNRGLYAAIRSQVILLPLLIIALLAQASDTAQAIQNRSA